MSEVMWNDNAAARTPDVGGSSSGGRMEALQVVCHVAAHIVLLLPLRILYLHHRPGNLDPAFKFLFRLAWLARIQIPITVAAAMFIFDFRFEVDIDE